MTPNELYAKEPVEIIKDYRELVLSERSHGHLNIFESIDFDFKIYAYEFNRLPPAENDRTEVRILERYNQDTRRYWRWATVWFDNKPIMIALNAGREGDDSIKTYVTNHEGYIALAMYVREQCLKLCPALIEDDILTKLVHPEMSNDSYTTFYGETLGAYRSHF